MRPNLWSTALDLVRPAYLRIGDDGWSAFAFGVVHKRSNTRGAVFFQWHGFDKGDEITGGGSAELHRTTAPSRLNYPSTMATMPFSPGVASDFFNGLLVQVVA